MPRMVSYAIMALTLQYLRSIATTGAAYWPPWRVWAQPPMKLSFVIPAYNEEAWLGPCVASIMAQLAQERMDAEIIVVNNASTDRTRAVAAAFPGVRIIDEPRQGLVRARQAGFVAATGDLIANLDADTRLPPGWLAQVYTRFWRDPALVALSGPCIYDDLSAPVRMGVRLFYALAFVSYLTTRFVLNRSSLLQGGNYVIRRDALRAIGGYNTALEFYGEDIDVAYRLHPLGKVVFTLRLPIYASGRRLAAEGVLRTGVTYSLNYLWVILFQRPFSRGYRAIRRPAPRPSHPGAPDGHRDGGIRSQDARPDSTPSHQN
jgi:glycosyltransferase involved in cell wall biosynthesis